MAAFTAKDLQELTTQLLSQFTNQLRTENSRLRGDLLADLEQLLNAASGFNTLNGVCDKLSPVSPRRDTTHQTSENADNELHLPCLRNKGWDDLFPSVNSKESGGDGEWRSDLWAVSETDCLLATASMPFGPEDHSDGRLCPPHDGLARRFEIDFSADSDQDLFGGSGSPWRFVQTVWFQITSVLVILLNTVSLIVQFNHPESKRHLFWFDQALLSFYVVELISRMCFFGRAHLFGSPSLIAWNILDVVVVVAGVVDQWVLLMFPAFGQGPFRDILNKLMYLRVCRVLKIVRVVSLSDLTWTEEPWFQSFIGGVIIFNALLMGFETDVVWSGWFYIEQVFLVIYVFELCARVKGLGCFFLSSANLDCAWNWLDFTIVSSSTLDSWILPLYSLSMSSEKHKGKGHGMNFGQVMMLMRMLRLMRILRLAKLVKSVRPLYIMVTSVLAAVQGVAWVLVLTITVLYAMGIVTTRLIGHGLMFPDTHRVDDKDMKPFLTVSASMFTLFRLMSGSASADESDAIDSIMVRIPSFKFAFVFFMVTSSWTLLSILTAVVSENMISTTSSQEKELKLASDEEDRFQFMEDLKMLFRKLDASGDGYIEIEELTDFLHVKEHALSIARLCRVPARDVVLVFRNLRSRNGLVHVEHFLECMAEVGEPVTEKSVMRLEAHLKELHRQVGKLTGHFSLSDYEG